MGQWWIKLAGHKTPIPIESRKLPTIGSTLLYRAPAFVSIPCNWLCELVIVDAGGVDTNVRVGSAAKRISAPISHDGAPKELLHLANKESPRGR